MKLNFSPRAPTVSGTFGSPWDFNLFGFDQTTTSNPKKTPEMPDSLASTCLKLQNGSKHFPNCAPGDHVQDSLGWGKKQKTKNIENIHKSSMAVCYTTRKVCFKKPAVCKLAAIWQCQPLPMGLAKTSDIKKTGIPMLRNPKKAFERNASKAQEFPAASPHQPSERWYIQAFECSPTDASSRTCRLQPNNS